MINLRFLVNHKSCKNVFHMNISCFTVFQIFYYVDIDQGIPYLLVSSSAPINNVSTDHHKSCFVTQGRGDINGCDAEPSDS